MNEIEKLYENAGVEKKIMCDWTCNCGGKYGDICNVHCLHFEDNNLYYPPFTAEKQLELIKWLGKRHCCGCDEKLAITIGEDNYSFISVGLRTFEDEPEIFTDYCFGAKQFDKALAGLINNLWQDLTEEEKEDIREILNASI